MTDQHDLDRFIDQAAEQMVRREPTDALTPSVMARVKSGPAPSGQGRRVWSGLAAAAAIAALVIVVSLNRTPTRVRETPASEASAPPAQIRRVLSSQDSASSNDLAVEPIRLDPIAPQPIQVPDHIQVEPLGIEPLSATND